jgi:hypothetical protein
MWGALSDETGLSFTVAAGSSQRSHSWVRVLWDSPPYFTVSDLRLPFSSPPTTRRVTVEVFDPASTRVDYSLYSLGSDYSTENIRVYVAQQWIYANHIDNASYDTGYIITFTAPSHVNGSYPIVACIFVAAGMCLPNCWLEMVLRVTVSNQSFTFERAVQQHNNIQPLIILDNLESNKWTEPSKETIPISG